MKKLSFLCCLLLAMCSNLFAQDLTIDFPAGTIELNKFSNLIIEGYDGTKVLIYESFQENFLPNQSEGLTMISTRSESPQKDELLTYKIRGNRLIISKPMHQGTYLIKVPKRLNLVCTGEGFGYYGENKNYFIKNISGEIEISVSDMVNIQLEGLSNATSILTHGNIKASFVKMPKNGAISMDTYRGFVDLTLPSDAAASLNLSAKKGDIFTNFKINKKGQTKNPEHFLGTIGQGGIDVILHTEVGGNIYLRKR